LGNTTIVVQYGRKQTDKLGDGSFDSIELGGTLTLEATPEENPLALYNSAYAKLAEAVEEKLAEYQPREIKSTHTPSPYGADETKKPQAEEPKPAASGRGWIDDTVKKETDTIRERVQALPGENIKPKGEVTAIDEYGTPSTETIVPDEAVHYQKTRVFEVEAAKASNGNPFLKIRIGKRGEDGIPGQYTTARSFDAAVIKQAAIYDPDKDNGEDKPKGGYEYKIRNGDFVNVWGYFKPWKNDKSKFDLELQKIEVYEE
jgi:hypothetical protein